MKLLRPLIIVTLAICALPDSARSQDRKLEAVTQARAVQPICDSQGFIEFAKQVEDVRQRRLLSEAEFAEAMKEDNTIVLDARSDGSYEHLRIQGSKSLPYTSFSEKTLHELIPDRSTRILIYCRNNLLDTAPTGQAKASRDRHPYPDELGDHLNFIKAPKVALNVPTYITLMVYGYENVWQLNAVVDPNKSPIVFESSWPEDTTEIDQLLEELSKAPLDIKRD